MSDYASAELLEIETEQQMIGKTPTIPVCVTEKVITEEVTSQLIECGTIQIAANAIEELCPADPYRTRIQVTATTGKVALCHSKAQACAVAAEGTNSTPPKGLTGGANFSSITLLTTARLWLVDLSGSANAASYVIERRSP